MTRFIRRWKYTLTASFLIVVPSVAMLFFPHTRRLGAVALITFLIAFIRGVRRIR